MPSFFNSALLITSLSLGLTTGLAQAQEQPLPMTESFKDRIGTGVGHYKGMEFGYQTELFAYQACGKAYTRLHGKENSIQGCMFEFKLRQGHLEIEETSKAAGYCGACTPVNVYRVKDSGVIYLRTTVLPSAPECKEVKGSCW
jgi:hypothetical protein